jgi:hypothetical protein
MVKNAIAMLIFGNTQYIPGAIISTFLHKLYLKKLQLKVDLIVMIDDYIYKYKDELLKYFDVVKKIKMIEMNLSKEYYMIKKYSKWMKYSINKWQIMKYEEYDKILFLDTDFLPINEKFYDIFKFNTPAVTTNLPCEEGKELDKTFFMKKENVNIVKNSSVETYYKHSLKLNSSINATALMLSPNIKMYEEYIDFIKKIEKKGYISHSVSGVDETSLLFFFRYYKDIPIYCIPKKYSIAPWDDKDYDINNVYAINYVSQIKPWVRLPMFQWGEEYIWHILAKKALKKSKIITEIYIDCLLQNLYYFINNLQQINKKSGYNLDILKINKEKLNSLFITVSKNKNLMFSKETDLKKIKEIMDKSRNIHSIIKGKSIINYNEILKLIDDK